MWAHFGTLPGQFYLQLALWGGASLLVTYTVWIALKSWRRTSRGTLQTFERVRASRHGTIRTSLIRTANFLFVLSIGGLAVSGYGMYLQNKRQANIVEFHAPDCCTIVAVSPDSYHWKLRKTDGEEFWVDFCEGDGQYDPKAADAKPGMMLREIRYRMDSCGAFVAGNAFPIKFVKDPKTGRTLRTDY